MEFKDILLIHMGGLGDCCLSESVFHSVSRHFRQPVAALGTRRFLNLFKDYFTEVHGIESARWLYLFSSRPTDITWERIIFLGKDREGSLRERWQRFSRNPLLFIDMYPENAFGAPRPGPAGVHVEDYQLAQLPRYGVEALKIEPPLKPSSRVILYPEKGFKKEKWHYRNFIDLYHVLKSKGTEVRIIEPFDLALGLPDSLSLPELADVKEFLEGGGIFVSNDSGMAHFAGMLGLTTITLFTDFDPSVWRPRGTGHVLKQGENALDVGSVEEIISRCLASLPGRAQGNQKP